MKILQRYIAKTIILASALVILAVLILSFFISLLGELRDIGTGDYGISQALGHVFLRLPHDIYQFFPMLMLLGGVLGLGYLSAHYELTVMRASGMSIPKIVGAVIAAAIILIILAMFLGEFIGPTSIYLADKRKQSAENGGQAVATTAGVWIHEGNNFLHIDRVIGPHHLEGVKRYEFDSHHHLLAAYFAKSLVFQKGQWTIQDLVKTQFGVNQTKSSAATSTSWDLALNPNLLAIGMVEPEELSLPNLEKYYQHLLKNGQQASRFQFEFWRRVFQPLTTLVMVLLAVPFVFGSPRAATAGRRVLFGIMMGFIFYMLNAFLGQFSVVFQISPLIAALFPTLLFALVGYAFTLKVRN